MPWQVQHRHSQAFSRTHLGGDEHILALHDTAGNALREALADLLLVAVRSGAVDVPAPERHNFVVESEGEQLPASGCRPQSALRVSSRQTCVSTNDIKLRTNRTTKASYTSNDCSCIRGLKRCKGCFIRTYAVVDALKRIRGLPKKQRELQRPGRVSSLPVTNLDSSDDSSLDLAGLGLPGACNNERCSMACVNDIARGTSKPEPSRLAFSELGTYRVQFGASVGRCAI